MPINDKNIISAILRSSNKWNVHFKFKVKARILPKNQFLRLSGANTWISTCGIQGFDDLWLVQKSLQTYRKSLRNTTKHHTFKCYAQAEKTTTLYK